jgi:hypothetical protein
VRLTHSGMTQRVFRIDGVKTSSYEFLAKIPLDYNSRCFGSFSSGNSSPEVADFVQLCAWSILLLRPKPSLAYYPALIVCLATILSKGNSTSENSLFWILRTCVCTGFLKPDLYPNG